MDHAHQLGDHRDLKPGNVLFDENNEPKITDFGLAKKVGETTATRERCLLWASIGYMSPEQASGHTREATAAVDIYALGAMLYRLLAGRLRLKDLRPSNRSSWSSTRTRSYSPPAPSCPRDLETNCLKCLGEAARQPLPDCRRFGGRFAPLLERRTHRSTRRHPLGATGQLGTAAIRYQ